jgi:hypothetical protein
MSPASPRSIITSGSERECGSSLRLVHRSLSRALHPLQIVFRRRRHRRAYFNRLLCRLAAILHCSVGSLERNWGPISKSPFHQSTLIRVQEYGPFLPRKFERALQFDVRQNLSAARGGTPFHTAALAGPRRLQVIAHIASSILRAVRRKRACATAAKTRRRKREALTAHCRGVPGQDRTPHGGLARLSLASNHSRHDTRTS